MMARRKFLAQMEQIVPWAVLLAVLQLFYPQVDPQRWAVALCPGNHAADPLPATLELSQ